MSNTISVANFQVLDRSQNYRIFNVRTVVLAFEISITVQHLTFLTHPVYHINKNSVEYTICLQRRIYLTFTFSERHVTMCHYSDKQ